ncbi:MAG TPA: NAD(P)/FAD-dependent oxidoreductase [Kofleriaceae bacterium]|nr:NAD(P)/FAD-dependent oxidoreductase [Kofleriaceae bacterium]
MAAAEPAAEHVDVLIVGAGLSGVAAAYYLQTRCPRRSYAIVEARGAMGGTWDLFRYPGIRSDSDMYTLGYSFAPWTGDRAIADGASIRAYIEETARAHGIDRRIRYHQRVVRAAWSSADARWTVELARDGAPPATMTCGFLYMCSGYYAYDRGHEPELAGAAGYRGRIVHPQAWPADLDHAGKRIVVIGSGATAVTLVPALAATAAHVTMLQRSPSYVLSRPAVDATARRLRRALPARAAGELTRWKYVLLGAAFYQFCRRFPERARRLLTAGVRAQLGPDYDVDTHFNPRYQPWDQRLCLVPDADLFAAIRTGRADVVTDTIDRYTETGLALRSGRTLDADVVVTATGLRLLFLGGVALTVDGRAIEPARARVYRSTMLGGVPNLAMSIGYTNASWTLRCELIAGYVCRLLQRMERHGFASVVAEPTADDEPAELPLLALGAGYVQRAVGDFPRQGAADPWKVHQSYLRDLVALRHAPFDDGRLVFARAPVSRAHRASARAAGA